MPMKICISNAKREAKTWCVFPYRHYKHAVSSVMLLNIHHETVFPFDLLFLWMLFEAHGSSPPQSCMYTLSPFVTSHAEPWWLIMLARPHDVCLRSPTPDVQLFTLVLPTALENKQKQCAVTILWLSLQLNINVGELQNKVRSRISSSCCEVRGDVQQNKKKKVSLQLIKV